MTEQYKVVRIHRVNVYQIKKVGIIGGIQFVEKLNSHYIGPLEVHVLKALLEVGEAFRRQGLVGGVLVIWVCH